MKFPGAIPLLIATALLSGCGFWGGESEVEPSKLVDFSAEKQVDVAWSAQIGSGPGTMYHQFVPAVGDVNVYAADSRGEVVALSRVDGRKVWESDLDLVLSGGIGAGYGTVVVASEDGDVVALNAETGEELWRARAASEVVAQPQVNADLVVVQVINGQVAAYDRVTGEHRWTFDSQIPQLSLRGTSAPVLTSNVTLTGFANGKLVAIDNRSGSALWEQRVALAEGRSELERIVDIDGRPLIFNGIVFVGSYQGRLLALNPRGAQVIWAQDFSTYRGLAAGFGNVYAVSADDEIGAFDAGSSASVWHQDALRYRGLTSPVSLGDTLVVGDAQGYLHFMSQIDGHFVARYNFDSSGVFSDPVVVDDTLYVFSNDGKLSALTLN
ncbi:Outer membrane protein YfgL, lipoprotein component of the protein assembly complex (forms a complex with YaeT, YfiO, and NlpB) [Marinobacterium lacunae]|uniref:Outer membrane protein assembly factor BamB n=1 Tax=Marinobacterium lacunae TaxID=1232683 RepID=A0A081G270_9GAMM|nr:outer membrane protein assembly factor BamB [Marinobacterium lacunae]KEA64875.1 Outer membrane protein YfgL, lipoprotein component of the protein assembly complex (forms a complex with YaeT, YfiO, and NlpB) [Marinobacterium lacunae]